MDSINKFNALIINEAKRYEDIEEMSALEFLEDCMELEEIASKIVLHNDEEEYIFYTKEDTIDFLSKCMWDNYDVIIYYSAVNSIEIITNIIFLALKDEHTFTYKEKVEIIAHMFEDYITVYDGEDEEIVNYVLSKLYPLSPEKVYDEFFIDEDVSDSLLINYCDEVIKNHEILDEPILKKPDILKENNQIIFCQDINTYMRNKFITIIDEYSEEYDEKDLISFLSIYLSTQYSLDVFKESLYGKLYDNKKQEMKNKIYISILVIYDFYCSNKPIALIDDRTSLFLDYIEQNELFDTLILFKNDCDFREMAIKSFIDINVFGTVKESYVPSKKVFDKFRPISIIDNINKGK